MKIEIRGKKPRATSSTKTGLPPGTLIPHSDEDFTPSTLRLFSYTEEKFRETGGDEKIDISRIADSDEIRWIDITGIRDSALLKNIGDIFGIHPLVLEDIQNTDQRPKYEDYGDYVYLVTKMIWWDRKEKMIDIEQVSLILAPGLVLSFQEHAGDTFESVRNRIRDKKGRLRSSGGDYLFYALIDSIVDGYFPILEEIEEQFDEAEDKIFFQKQDNNAAELYKFSKLLTELRKISHPLREVCFQLQKEETPLIAKNTKLFLKDIQDHVFRIIDSIETLREKLIELRNMHTTNLSNNMNIIIKVLTVISTIFIPLTFIVGIYGMNFKYMPELRVPWAYPAVWGVMILLSIGMIIIFKRKKWF